MKKNKMMRLASVLLIAVILSTCAVSGTFAKYVTEKTATETARVAKWAYGTTVLSFADLFAESYGTTVASQANDNVIAPGTSGDATFKFAPSYNTCEVSYSLTVDTTGSACADSIKNNKNIVWKLNDGNWGDWDTLLASIKGLSQSSNAPGTAVTIEGTVYWAWLFDENDTTVTGYTATNLDATDTTMGTYAGETGDLAVTLSITVTATQID